MADAAYDAGSAFSSTAKNVLSPTAGSALSPTECLVREHRCLFPEIGLTFFWWQNAAGTLLWAQWHHCTPGTPAPVLPEAVLPKAVSPAPVSLSPVSLSPVQGVAAAAPTADPVSASTASCHPLPTVLSPVFSPARYREDARVWQPLPDVAPGTGHARRVWRAILQIPLGETRSYGELAREVASSPQAVGQACRHNPWPLFVPCHRVVGRGFPQDTGGYAGQRGGELLRVKRWLLAHEGAAFGHLGKCLPESWSAEFFPE